MQTHSPFERLIPLIGEEAFCRLQNAVVTVVGLGGVGGTVAEALARSGIGGLILIDGDVFEESNLNRQLGALNSTLGRSKAEVWAERVRDINPSLSVKGIRAFYTGGREMFSEKTDYIADCIDSLPEKTELIAAANELDIPVLSAMGAANKTDPMRFKVADIYSTKYCPMARAMRSRLRARGIPSATVVYSDEQVTAGAALYSFMPVTSAMGLVMANRIISDIASGEHQT